MELRELKKQGELTFVNFGITNTVAGLVATTRDMYTLRGKVKSQFSLLWKHCRQLMNTVDSVGKQMHDQKIKQLPESERTDYVPLSEGYDEFSDHLTTYLEVWLRSRAAGTATQLIEKIEAHAEDK